MGDGAQGGALVPADDRSIPETFVGKLEPNYYCRGWNEKRQKYCRARSGWGTEHEGVGRCRFHGGTNEGDGRVTHGQTRRYGGIKSPRIRELLEQFVDDEDPLDVGEDLALVRSALHDFIDRASSGATQRSAEAKTLNATLDEYEIALGDEITDAQREQLGRARAAIATITEERALPDTAEAIRKFGDTLSKMAQREKQLRAAGAVSLDQIRRFLAAVDRVLQLHVTDEKLRQSIRKDIYAIRV